MKGLKDCPFCGQQPEVGRGGPGNLVWYISCSQEDHEASIQHSGTRKNAIAAWNERTKV